MITLSLEISRPITLDELDAITDRIAALGLEPGAATITCVP